MKLLGPFILVGTMIASPGSRRVLSKSVCQNWPLLCLLMTVPSALTRKTRFASACRVGPPASLRYADKCFRG